MERLFRGVVAYGVQVVWAVQAAIALGSDYPASYIALSGLEATGVLFILRPHSWSGGWQRPGAAFGTLLVWTVVMLHLRPDSPGFIWRFALLVFLLLLLLIAFMPRLLAWAMRSLPPAA